MSLTIEFDIDRKKLKDAQSNNAKYFTELQQLKIGKQLFQTQLDQLKNEKKDLK